MLQRRRLYSTCRWSGAVSNGSVSSPGSWFLQLASFKGLKRRRHSLLELPWVEDGQFFLRRDNNTFSPPAWANSLSQKNVFSQQSVKNAQTYIESGDETSHCAPYMRRVSWEHRGGVLGTWPTCTAHPGVESGTAATQNWVSQ